MSRDLPVRWLALGGTIQARGHDPLDTDRYWQTGASLTPESLLEPVRTLIGPIEIEVVDARPSHDLSPMTVLVLAERLRAFDAASLSGVVVSLGSNGLEEVAFLLWLFGAPTPVVLTAAMRPPTAIGSDALPNLVAAIAVARAEESRAHGVVVVSDGAVLHPAELIKSHSSDVDSFRASAQALGRLTSAGVPRYERTPRPSPLADRAIPDDLAPVELVTSYLGADGAAIRSAVERGVKAIVSAGTGGGFPTSAERAALEEARAAGVVICQAQRTPYGAVNRATEPFLCAGTLSPQKARLVLAIALADGSPAGEDVQRLLDLAAGVHSA